ncbi:VOC family protein [Actinoplanes sp. NBC_00393]|uniref:VOC family protein n=1 Tax=Actinoplanes sp. NBC_00393 TaxID=2975953 RepID=UPI002E21A4B0
MAITTVTHINLRGNARQALEFYRSVFGGELTAFTHGDAGTPDVSPDQLTWGQVRSPEGFHIMAYDVPPARTWNQGDNPFFVSVRGQDADEISGYWKKLSEGSTVIVDLGPAGWSPLYGMLTDPFGITWVLDIAV